MTDTGNDVGNPRDFVVVTSEAGGAFCNEVRHLTFMTDVKASLPDSFEHLAKK